MGASQLSFIARFGLIPAFIALSVGACAYRQEKGGSAPGASSGARNAAGASPSFAQVRDQVFGPRCTTCHHHPSDFIDYGKTFAEREQIKNRVFVVRDMPQDGPLSADQSTLLQSWLDAGAPEQSQAAAPIPVTPPTAPANAPLAATWDNVQKHFLIPYCVGCHSGTHPKGGLDLTSLDEIRAEGADTLLDRVFANRIKPMPPSKRVRESITGEEKALFVDWIEAGLPDADGVPMPLPAPVTTPKPVPTPTIVPTPDPTAVPTPTPTPTPSPTPIAPTLSFAQVQAQVFTVRCMTCHHHQSDFGDYASTFDVRDDIRQRVFIDKDMPKDGPLSAEQNALLLKWLDAGAPERLDYK